MRPPGLDHGAGVGLGEDDGHYASSGFSPNRPCRPDEQDDEKGEGEGQQRGPPGRPDPGSDESGDDGKAEGGDHGAENAAHAAEHYHGHQHRHPFPMLGREEAEDEAHKPACCTGKADADGEGQDADRVHVDTKKLGRLAIPRWSPGSHSRGANI